MTRSSPWLTALLQMVVLGTVVAFASPWLAAEEHSLPTPGRSDDIALRGLNARPVYNGSVVAGGVYSLDELRAAVERDPIVAAHYQDANLDAMRAVTLTAGRAAYVSYRAGDRVYWTRHRVWLKAGETVLTDGTTVIRARCGNCVSAVKQDAVAAVEPAAGELDDFVVPPSSDAGVDPLAAEAEAGLASLLDVPFAHEAVASLAAASPLFVSGLVERDPIGPSGPFFVPPPLMLPPDEEPVTQAPEPGDAGGGDPSAGTITPVVVDPAESGDTTASTGVTSAPEPGAIWLVMAGVLGLASRRWRRR